MILTDDREDPDHPVHVLSHNEVTRTEDWFDATRQPEGTFKATGIERVREEQLGIERAEEARER
jgi:polyisoprenoid-binding protein YceI